MNISRLLTVATVVGGAIAVRRHFPRGHGPDRRPRATMMRRMMTRMMERMPPDSPPKLITSILPRLLEQNNEIIELLREQNELLRRAQPQPLIRESDFVED